MSWDSLYLLQIDAKKEQLEKARQELEEAEDELKDKKDAKAEAWVILFNSC